jgi:hypothetical protein
MQSTGRAVLIYSLLRIGLFVFPFALLLGFLNGKDGIVLAAVLAALISFVASYFLLQSQRAPLASALDTWVAHRREVSDRKTASEDEAADEIRAMQSGDH